MSLKRTMQKFGRRLSPLTNAVMGFLAVGALKTFRLINRTAMANFAGGLMRTVGPLLPEHRIGRANLVAAFPEKSADEIEAILRGVWDNLGRVAAEFTHIDRLHIQDPDKPGTDDIVYDQATFDRFHQLRLDGKPALLFTAHLANWELPAYVAAVYKLHLHVLFRRPSLGAAGDAILKIRSNSMGTLVPTGLGAPLRLLRTLEAGGHVAMLVDQHNVQGVDVTFFGRRCKANSLIAQLARHIESPIHGARMVRLPGNNSFRIHVTEEIAPARDTEGKIDITATMQKITDVVEGWVREHPEQWLWVHRRWR